VGNIANIDNTLVSAVVDALAGKLPSGWQTVIASPPKRDRAPAGTAVITIRRPGTPAGRLFVAAKTRLEPRDVDYLAVTLGPTASRAILVAAPFISPRTQERLKAKGFAYADLAGNMRISLAQPALFIETTGAIENPEPKLRDRRSLKGPKAGRLVRALCDYRPPIGVRDLAKRAGVDPGYASRVVDFLSREALVTRTTRGPVTEIDWPALLRRWSQEYSPFQMPRAAMYLAPRGIAAVIEKLKRISVRYAVSGSWAASQIAPVAPPRLLLVHIEKPAAVASELDVRPTDAGANVALATPFDPVVYERTSSKNGVTMAALSQVAADLLTSPGRGPNEGEALIEWMREHEDAWRA